MRAASLVTEELLGKSEVSEAVQGVADGTQGEQAWLRNQKL